MRPFSTSFYRIFVDTFYTNFGFIRQITLLKIMGVALYEKNYKSLLLNLNRPSTKGTTNQIVNTTAATAVPRCKENKS